MSLLKKEVLISIATSSAAYLIANAIERSLIRVFHPSLIELTWISDLVLSILLGGATYLWLNLRATQMSLRKAEMAQVAIDTELSLAAEIQRNLLPPIPASSGVIRWGAMLKPAGKIGGDSYDFVPVGSDEILVLIADISGKGIPAALSLAAIHSLFRLLSRESSDPAFLVQKISAALYADNQGSVFMTCILGLFDLGNKRLTYVNAGHPAGVLITPKGTYFMESSGTPAGMFPGSEYKSICVPLEYGMVGLLFTDGVSESLPEEQLAAGDFLRNFVLTNPNKENPNLLCESILHLARTGRGPTGDVDWKDDQTVLAFVLEPEPSKVPYEALKI